MGLIICFDLSFVYEELLLLWAGPVPVHLPDGVVQHSR